MASSVSPLRAAALLVVFTGAFLLPATARAVPHLAARVAPKGLSRLDAFGASVALARTSLFISDPGDDDKGLDAGAV